MENNSISVGHPVLDALLSGRGGIEPGRSYLVSSLERFSPVEILREVLFRVDMSKVLQVAYTSEGFVTPYDNETDHQFLTLAQHDFLGLDPSIIINCLGDLEGNGIKVVVISQLDEILGGEYKVDRYKDRGTLDYIREIRENLNKRNIALVVYAPLDREATELESSRPVDWPNYVPLRGYYKWSRRLDNEFHTELFVCPTIMECTIFRGKHSGYEQAIGDIAFIERNYFKQIQRPRDLV